MAMRSFVLFAIHATISIASASVEYLFRQPVLINDGTDKVLGDLTIQGGDEPADIIFQFAKRHNLTPSHQEEMLNKVCAIVRCSRKAAVVWKSGEVDVGGGSTETFLLLENQEPVDAVHDFVQKHNLTTSDQKALVTDACSAVLCSRTHPVVWSKSVAVDGTLLQVEVLEGQEPSDSIYAALGPLGVLHSDRQKLVRLAVQDGVAWSRQYALLFSGAILPRVNGAEREEETGKIIFSLYDDGVEPIDALFRFANQNGIEDGDFDHIVGYIMPQVCEVAVCRRMRPIVWRSNFDEKHNLGSFGVLRNEEPVDAVDYFAQENNLSLQGRQSILDLVCKELECKRLAPVVWRTPIMDESGNLLGSFTVMENEEVADAAHRFLTAFEVQLDQHGLKNYIFANACKSLRVKCTRINANMFDREISGTDGSVIDRLTIRDNQEPADIAYQWCQSRDLGEDFMFALIEEVCNEAGVRCRRNAPIIKSIPLSGPDGVEVGVFDVKLREEPVDALYRFFSRNGLFRLGWNLNSVLPQLCIMSDVVCDRTVAIKFHHTNFTMGEKKWTGPLTIKEGEEVIDILYGMRLAHNLTVEDQMHAFANICKSPEIYCSRSKAIVHSLQNISYNDYERFGNETCKRKYASIQYLRTFSESFMGRRLPSFLQGDGSAAMAVFEHTLFGIALLSFAITSAAIALYFIGRKNPLSVGAHFVTYLYTFVIISSLHTLFIEPVNDIDRAMHVFEGKLPDLFIYEGEEPADSILRWAKEASRRFHPIVRQPIHWEILDKICIESLTCTRRRAWEVIDMGAVTLAGNHYPIEFSNPMVTQHATGDCVSEGADSCLISLAEESAGILCRRLHPRPINCVNDISSHILQQLENHNSRRIGAKDAYTKLLLEMDAPFNELFAALESSVRPRGVNLAPFSRVDNGTATYDEWDLHVKEAFAAVDAFYKIKDPDSRQWNDKPCEPVFGGALCAKNDKDGNLLIEM